MSLESTLERVVTDWLYPLSSKSDFCFKLPDGTSTQDTSPANFEASVLRAASDNYWTVATNYRQVEQGDRVWVYYGGADGDLGVVGLGIVSGVDAPAGGRADVHLRWDRTRTKRLLLKPVPASDVRQFVWPRAAVTNLSAHPQLVRRLLRHAGISAKSAPAINMPTASSSTITYTPPSKITAHRRHDALIGPVRIRLETCGWQAVPFDVAPMRVDLAMAKGRRVLLIEFKTITRSTFKAAVREAFAQLHEYDWRYQMLHPRDLRKVHRWAVFERRPDDDDIQFLEDSGLLVSWASKRSRRLVHGDETQRRLLRLSVFT